MARKKIRGAGFRRTIISLTALFFLLVAVGITTSLVQERQNLVGLAQNIICRRIPAGNYDVKVKTYEPTPWEITCPWPGGRWSGKLPAITIPFGYRWIPTIYKGGSYSVDTNLKDICKPIKPIESLEAGWSDICKVCQYIDCSKVKIKGKGTVEKINCLLGVYQAEGRGNINLTYQGSGLGSCSAKATYEGRLTGSFIIGTITPTVEPKPTVVCRELWWFDNTHRYCSKKTFCGLYMYQGLRTFETKEKCQAAL